MANVKKDLIKKSEDLIEDIFDHYDNYSQEDKERVEKFMNDMASLNQYLDKYDKKKSAWEKFIESVGKFFGKK